jgi:hypothetical protein
MRKFHIAKLIAVTLSIVSVSCASGFMDEAQKESEKTLSDMNVSYQSSGVKECDEVIALINKSVKSPDEGYLAKAAREYVLNAARDEISKQVQQEKDPAKLSKACGEIKSSIEGQLSGK